MCRDHHHARLDHRLDSGSGDLRALARLSGDPRRHRSCRHGWARRRRYGAPHGGARVGPRHGFRRARRAHCALACRVPRLRGQAPRRETERRCARPTRRIGQRAASDRVLVDVYNAISILHRVPIGGETSTVHGPARLILATGEEPFHTTADGAPSSITPTPVNPCGSTMPASPVAAGTGARPHALRSTPTPHGSGSSSIRSTPPTTRCRNRSRTARQPAAAPQLRTIDITSR